LYRLVCGPRPTVRSVGAAGEVGPLLSFSTVP
jgi:hypothetical protein